MIKTCAVCGKEFDGHGRAKYCPDCRATGTVRTRRYYQIHREQILAKQTERREKLKTLKICARCGCEFSRHGNAKFCTDCSAANYRDYQARYTEARRRGQTIVKRAAKPKYDTKKARLAYLRRCLEQAQTPEIRSRYFRQYVLLKQELLRGAVS